MGQSHQLDMSTPVGAARTSTHIDKPFDPFLDDGWGRGEPGHQLSHDFGDQFVVRERLSRLHNPYDASLAERL